ncbi:MAG: hypothetical protein CMO78_04145 [Verrucomicrobiales bacterium]|nr:hypothetical protein [Verrucomicrobiales bacterium]
MAAHQPADHRSANQNRMNHQFKKMAARVSAFMDRDTGDFEEISRELFALQFEHVPPYRSYCEELGVNPDSRLPVPAIPTTAFRDYLITSLPEDERETVFHSSSTTGQSPSQHYHNANSLKLYEHSLTKGFHQALQATVRTLSLTPPPKQAPHSSLAHMLNSVQLEPYFTGTATPEGWRVDINQTVDFCQSSNEPITLMGTAFSFVHLCDAIDSIQLPSGSRIFETGGYKNQSRELPKMELHQLIGQKLNVPLNYIHCEYGMCELSTQAYAIGQGAFQFPHWAQARIVSPETGKPSTINETGLLEVVDLANVYSVQAIQTGDLAKRAEGGRFELIGRLANREPRGCSLNASHAPTPFKQTHD